MNKVVYIEVKSTTAEFSVSLPKNCKEYKQFLSINPGEKLTFNSPSGEPIHMTPYYRRWYKDTYKIFCRDDRKLPVFTEWPVK